MAWALASLLQRNPNQDVIQCSLNLYLFGYEYESSSLPRRRLPYVVAQLHHLFSLQQFGRGVNPNGRNGIPCKVFDAVTSRVPSPIARSFPRPWPSPSLAINCTFSKCIIAFLGTANLKTDDNVCNLLRDHCVEAGGACSLPLWLLDSEL